MRTLALSLLLGLAAPSALAYPALAEKKATQGAPSAGQGMAMPPVDETAPQVAALPAPETASAPAEGASSGLPVMSEPPAGKPVTDEEILRKRSRALTEGLRCPVCQGLSAADSQAESAVAMCVRTEDLVRAGYSDEQIRAWFVDKYGEWVLLEPPRSGRHWLIWLGPLAFLGLGGLVVTWRMTSAAAPREEGQALTSKEEDPYERRILDELERS